MAEPAVAFRPLPAGGSLRASTSTPPACAPPPELPGAIAKKKIFFSRPLPDRVGGGGRGDRGGRADHRSLRRFPFTPGFFADVMIGNGVAGIFLGCLFGRRGLEAAMIAHGSADLWLQGTMRTFP